MANELVTSVKLQADNGQYNAEFTRSGQVTQSLGSMLQTMGAQATQATGGLNGVAQASREAGNQQQQTHSAFMDALRDQVATMGMSTEALLRYRSVQAGVATEAAPWIQQLQNQKAAQLAAAEAARQEEAAQREAAAQKHSNEAFVKSLKTQAETQGLSTTEMLRYRAAQLGVSASAEQYIKAIEAGSNANKIGTISAGQHAAAMRMLPAQMTDVVTSVASGMPIWMVAIQQGGQIKDSFGGAGNALRAMAGAVTPAVAGFGVLAAAAGLAIAAYAQGSAEADKMNHAILLSGNASGVTSSQLRAYAVQIDAVVGTQGQAVDALAAMTRAGVAGGETMRQYAQVAVEWERATGEAVDKTAEKFASLQNDPLKSVVKLNEGMNFLTASTYEQIKSLVEQGHTTEAANVAQKAYADALGSRSADMVKQLGSVERAWRAIKDVVSDTWDAIKSVGREVGPQAAVAAQEQAIAYLQDQLDSGKGTAKTEARLRAAQAHLLVLQEQSNTEAINAALGQQQAEATKATVAWNEEIGKYASRQTREMEAKLSLREKYNKMLATAGDDEVKRAEIKKQLAEAEAEIEKRFKEKKSGGSGGIKVSDTELASMRAQLTAAQQYHQQLLSVGAAASDLNAGERESLKISEELRFATDAKTKARLLEKQAVADALGVQLRSNKGLEESQKAHQKAIDANFSEAAALEERVKQQEAANAVIGKGQVAIAEMTLATLEHRKAEAENRDNYDPDYIASLEAKIAVQKRWVAVLQDGDAKQFDAHSEKLRDNARDMAAVYADELRLANATGLERERIVAARQVELRYAKERAAIERSSATAEEKQRRNAEMAATEQIETAAAVSKATGDYMAKSSDDINKSLTDALLRGFEAGKDGAKNLADTVENMFGTMVLRPVISAGMAPVSKAINDSMAQLGIGTGSNSGLINALTDWSGWGEKSSNFLMDQGMSWVTKGWESAGSSLMSLGSTVQSVDQALKSIPGFGGGIGSATGYLGSIYALTQGQYGSGIGSAIGTYIAPGIGTMIGGALGGLVDSMFGAAGTKEYGGTAMYSAALGAQTSTAHGAFGTGFGGVDANEQILANVSGISKSIALALDATAKTFGQTVGYEAAAGFASDFGDEATWGGLRIALNGADIVNWDDTRTSKWAPKEFASGDEGYKQYLDAVALDVKTALLGMDLPTWASQLVSAATDLDTINTALQQIGATKAVFETLGQSMQMFAGISGELQTQLLGAAGGIEALATNANTFYGAFFSEAERMAQLQGTLRDTLAGQGLAIDPAVGEAAKAQFRQAVEDAMGAGNGALASQLLSMSGAFAQAADYAQKAADETTKAAQEQAKAAADMAAALRNSLVSFEGRLGSSFARQYQAQDLAASVQSLFASVGIDKDAGMLAQRIMAATRADVEEYFRVMWSQLDTDEARKQLIDVSSALLDFSAAAQQTVSDLAHQFSESASAALSARTSAGSLLDRIDGAMGGTGTAYALKREQDLWAAMATASYTQQIDLASELTDSVLNRMQLEKQSADKLSNLYRTLRDSIEATRLGALSPLTLGQKVKEAGDQFYAAVEKARAGDTDAAGQVAGLRQTYLELAQRYYAASDDYTAVFQATEGAITGLAGQLQTDAEQQLAASQATVAQLQQLRSIAESAYQQADRDYASSSAALQDQIALMASMDGGIATVSELLAGMPAELAARLQPLLGAGTSDQALIALMRGAQDASPGLMLGDLQRMGINAGASAAQVARVSGQLYSDADVAALLAAGRQNYPGYSLDQLAALGQSQYGISREQLDRVINGSHRDGLDRVPFDGYIGELHRDEAVLNERQADDWRRFDLANLERFMQALISESKMLRAQQAELFGLLANVTSQAGDKTAEQLRQALREVALAMKGPR